MALATALFELTALILLLWILADPSGHTQTRALTFSLSIGIVVVRNIRLLASIAKIDIKSKALSLAVWGSTIAPRAGTYLLSKEHLIALFRNFFDASYREQLLKQRREFRRMFVEYCEIGEGAPDHTEVVEDTIQYQKEIERRYAIGEVVVGGVGGLVALAAGVFHSFAGFALLLSVYLALFPVSMFLRSEIVGSLSYTANPYDGENGGPRYRLPTVLFMRSWNEMLLENPSMLHKLILTSVVRGEFNEGYEIGRDLIERTYAGETTLSDEFDDVVEERFGEDSRESSIIRRAVERIIGI